MCLFRVVVQTAFFIFLPSCIPQTDFPLVSFCYLLFSFYHISPSPNMLSVLRAVDNIV